jgi:hypothetical protein
MFRLKTEQGESLAFDMTNSRLDNSLNLVQRYRPPIGLYPIPQPIYQTRFVDFGKKERILKEIIAYKINYPIHYIKANIEKLHAEAGCHDKTQMLRQNDSIRSGGRLMNYSDFRDSAFETWNLTMVAGS